MSTENQAVSAAPSAGFISHPGIYLAFPAYGSKIDCPFAMSVLQLMNIPDLVIHIDVMNGDSLVSRARNKLARNFLDGFTAQGPDGQMTKVRCDWMLFLDTDLIFDPKDIKTLYDVAVRRGPNIYCGTYPIKQLKPKIVFNMMEGCVPDAEGVVEVRESGTGFMLIHRNVFETMKEKLAEVIRYEADAGGMSVARQIEHDFFRVGVFTDPVYKYKRYLSEDWSFCQTWRELGGKIFLHTRLQAQHIGQITYPVPTKDIMEVAKIHATALEQYKAQQEREKERMGVPPLSAPIAPAKYEPAVAVAG